MRAKYLAFAEAYLNEANFNGAAAARLAGYKGKSNVVASRLLANDSIQEYIRQRLTEKCMGSDEVLARLAEQARADIGPYIKEGGGIDWAKVKERGYLVKSVSLTDKGERIELHDAQSALVWIGKHHKLFTERVEVEGEILVKVDR
jgi:phage terminase small subunit